MKVKFEKSYNEIISLENLFAAWQEFVRGKRSKKDVQEFGVKLIDNIQQLHEDLASFTYEHGTYRAFNISDPKPRNIHKAEVRDRVLHHAIYRQLYPFFDKLFIFDSHSCRLGKGTHRAIERFQTLACRVSKNNTKTAWALKCDIRKFFASIDHKILLNILSDHIVDRNVIELLRKIIGSFDFQGNGKGLPLGNLTSQLFCNVYMNELDQFVKHTLGAKYYVRYADDFVLLSESKEWLVRRLFQMSGFLFGRLNLTIHPDKVFIKTLASGIDFLGWVHFPTHRVIRTTTRNRMFRRIKEHPTNQTLNSYLGLLCHGNCYGLEREISNLHWLSAGDFPLPGVSI